MAFRVTNQASQQAALNNIFRISEEMFKTQQQLSSGKRITAASDDPTAAREALNLRANLRQTQQFVRNIDNVRNFARSADSSLDDVSSNLARAKELAISQLGGLSTATTRRFTALEIDNILTQVMKSGNDRFGSRYLFSGTRFDTKPFTTDASGGLYHGDTGAMKLSVERDMTVQVNLPGSQVLATDLNPSVTGDTTLASLNGGAGVPAGSFSIVNRAGASATITLSASGALDNVINAINAAGLNITASINANKNGIKLTDNSPVITHALTVTEVGGGSTAQKLGILGQKNGNIEGLDLSPKLTAATAVSQLNGGAGAALKSINIANGGASGAISLASANTIGDVINAINNSGLNVTAAINSQGNALAVTSNNSSTIAVVREVGTDKTAEELGIGGGRNILTALVQLKKAMENSDIFAISALVDNLDLGIVSLGGNRANFGAITHRLETNQTGLNKDVVDSTSQLADVEDTDLAQKASQLASLESAFQATLNTTARIIQPSILNFLG